MTPEVSQAVLEIKDAYAEATVSASEDGDGGAIVTVSTVPLSAIYKQRETWIGFHITYPYPHADVYPHFVREDLKRVDGKALGDPQDPNGPGVSRAEFQKQPATQLSRRSNHWAAGTDTALFKLRKVLRWLNDRN